MLKLGSQVSVLWTAAAKLFVRTSVTQLSTAPTKNNIIIEPLQESRSQEVLDLLTTIFLRDETLSKRFPPCPTDKRKQDFQKYAMELLPSRFSVMATDGPGGPVVGCCLSRVLSRESLMGFCPQEPDPSEDPLIPSVIHMLTTVHQQLDLFSTLNIDKILDVGMMAVEPHYLGRGISSQLLLSSIELGAREGLRAAKADCTVGRSAQAALRIGMTVVFQLPYVKYTHSGRVVFRSIGDGNDELIVLAARLQPEKPHVLPIKCQ